MIFQEPMTSLNPVLAVGEQIAEAVRLHRGAGRAEALEIAAGALVAVGMPRPRDVMREFPHRLSGGMRQRVMIAMALVCRPSLLLADEPTTALDVTIQAQVLELLARLRREQGTAMMLISHDLGVVARHADVVCVMYGGRPVEYAGVFELFDRPLHPYTRGLLRAIPRLEERRRRLSTIEEFLGDPAEHRRADGSGRAVVPWWPAADPPPDLARDGGGDFVLHKVEPGHWIGCWRTGSLAQAPPEPPDLADLRET
jgi:ABC-type dipeptide/oligopeptide/nickel transport system ATPase component